MKFKVDKYEVYNRGRTFTILKFPRTENAWAFDDAPEEDNGEYLLSYSASGVTLNNIPLRYYNQNTPTDKMLMFDLGTYYPGYNGYVEFCVTNSSGYSYNSLIDGLGDSYGYYFSIEKIG